MVKVELWAAKIPGLPGIFADHYWLLVLRGVESSHNQTCDRWEIWQHPHQNSSCWGHLHKNLLDPYQGVGNGQSRLIQKWLNDDALLMVKKIESSPSNYPFIQRYRYWPGPNSNTFAQWVVSDKMELGARAIGKSFPLPEWARWQCDQGLAFHWSRKSGVIACPPNDRKSMTSVNIPDRRGHEWPATKPLNLVGPSWELNTSTAVSIHCQQNDQAYGAERSRHVLSLVGLPPSLAIDL